jgi:hypothetical protein
MLKTLGFIIFSIIIYLIATILAILLIRRIWRYQWGIQNPYIDEGQTTQWSKEKVQKDKQRYTRHKKIEKVNVTELYDCSLIVKQHFIFSSEGVFYFILITVTKWRYMSRCHWTVHFLVNFACKETMWIKKCKVKWNNLMCIMSTISIANTYVNHHNNSVLDCTQMM